MTDLLCLLDSYTLSHESGDSGLKSCIWNISVARKLKGGFHLGTRTAYNAHDVREELRARAVLECRDNGEPSLVDDDIEDCKDSKKSNSNDEDTYAIHLDGLPDRKKGSEMAPTSHLSKEEEKGLRQRKNKSASEIPNEPWTEETYDNDEFQKVRDMDPIDMFGALPPPALRLAQIKSRESLISYIEAANLAVAILRITGAKDKKDVEES